MKILKRCRIEGVADVGANGRYSIRSVLLSGGRLVATNGKILASVPVTVEDGDIDGLVSARAFGLARGRNSGGHFSIAAGVKGASFKAAESDVKISRPQGAFPDLKDVVPERCSGGVELLLNAELLLKLSRAFGERGRIKIFIPVGWDGKTALRVEPFEGIEGAEGCIMPLRP